MRVTFEKVDIIQMLRQVLGYDITDDDVVITSDPFEVQVSHVDVDRLAQKPTETPELSAELMRALQQIPSTPVTTADETSELPEEEEILTMEDVLTRNQKLSKERLARPLGPEEFEDPPPITEDELHGRRKRG